MLSLRRCTIVVLSVLLAAGTSMPTWGAEQQAPGAEQQQPPWMQPDVVKAAAEIGLTPEQQAPFRDAVTTMLTKMRQDVNRVLNGIDNRDIPRKLETRRKMRVRELNETMQQLLTAEQMPKYETYRDLLLTKMTPPRGGGRGGR